VKGAAPWRRFCGWVLDGFVAVFLLLIGLWIGFTLSSFFAITFFVVSLWMYFALLESSARQGTLAKMLLRERVTDLDGNRITFERATGRHFAMYLSAVSPFLVGFFMAFVTRRRQALHDYVSRTLVTDAQTRSAGP
jgi:uncharacterized RDD family membrane protein YckC